MKVTRHLIIIDDSTDDAFLTKRALEAQTENLNKEIKITTFSTAKDFFNYAKNILHNDYEIIDLVLLDINIPFSNGFDILKYIRANQAISTTPVVMLSSSTNQEDIRRSYEFGANSYIQKPVDYKKFREIAYLITQYWLEINLSSKENTQPILV